MNGRQLRNVEYGVWVKLSAKAILICTNTMHKVATDIEQKITIPLIHIADATGCVLQQDRVKKVGLLGTRFTMEQTFYTSRLKEIFGIDVVTPNAQQRDTVHNIIYEQLCKGLVCLLLAWRWPVLSLSIPWL